MFEIGLLYKFDQLAFFFKVHKSSGISVYVDILMNIFRFH